MVKLTVSAFPSLLAMTFAVPVARAVTVTVAPLADDTVSFVASVDVHAGDLALIVAPLASATVAVRSILAPGVNVLMSVPGKMVTLATTAGATSPLPPQPAASNVANKDAR